jgi:hypothetical protein
MKHIASTTMLLLFTIITATGFSQMANSTPKPKLFAAYPESIDCSVSELSRIFTIAQGQQASISFAGNFAFNGTVSSNMAKFSNLQSVVIKSPQFNHAIFHVSKRINSDNSTVYVGRIIHDSFADGYELKRDAAGSYRLQKIETEKVMPECSQQ